MSGEFLAVKDIRKSFAGVQALRGVSLAIDRGEIRCLVGENGCGKSTLIKVMAGVYVPDEGEIAINGKAHKRLTPMGAIREGIQVIYQDFSLFPNLTAAENIALNYQLSQGRRWVSWREIRRIAEEALAQIDVRIDLSANVEDLSVADKQLIAIARALLQNARLIIMDEPTTALTQREVRSLFRVVKNLQQKGISILFVSHKLNEVLEIADKVTVMRNGKVVADGDASEFDWAKLVYFMTGREIKESPYTPPPRAEKTQSLLRVEGLGQKGSFADISFELYPGEILGITGLLGSGRTELAMALFGLRPADRGQVYIDGKPVRLRSVQEAIRNRIGYVPEDRLTEGLFLPQPIAKNIVASTVEKFLNRWKLLDGRKAGAEVDAWVKNLSIVTPSPLLPVQSLSGGNQQRVVLAKWLATAPRILILNGPTVGVDIGSKADIHATLRRLAQQGMGILIISDDIPELLQNCNRILLMRRGRIVEEFRPDQVSENELAQKLTGA
ncbi:MAG TPA: sugar ABC transporter ATP-binding protein [Firmicutes bacterium]|nr:sugar ABC transporter ATP-binding protein [Bacillota bacterium]